MPAENQSRREEPGELLEALPGTLDYFNPVENRRPPWDPKDLTPIVMVAIVAAFDFILLSSPQKLSARLGFYTPFVMPPVFLLFALIYAIFSKPKPGWTLVSGAFLSAVGLTLHIAIPAAIFFF